MQLNAVYSQNSSVPYIITFKVLGYLQK